MSDKQYPYTFNIEPTNCCGMFSVDHFRQDGSNPNYYWGSGLPRVVDPIPKEKVFEKFEQDLHDAIKREIEDDGHQSGGYMLQATFVRGKSPEFPELQEHMLNNGWELTSEWRNSNTGNMVGLFQKYVDFEEFREELKEEGYFDDDEEEDYEEEF
jgi:hypothetical protein